MIRDYGGHSVVKLLAFSYRFYPFPIMKIIDTVTETLFLLSCLLGYIFIKHGNRVLRFKPFIALRILYILGATDSESGLDGVVPWISREMMCDRILALPDVCSRAAQSPQNTQACTLLLSHSLF